MKLKLIIIVYNTHITVHLLYVHTVRVYVNVSICYGKSNESTY